MAREREVFRCPARACVGMLVCLSPALSRVGMAPPFADDGPSPDMFKMKGCSSRRWADAICLVSIFLSHRRAQAIARTPSPLVWLAHGHGPTEGCDGTK